MWKVNKILAIIAFLIFLMRGDLFCAEQDSAGNIENKLKYSIILEKKIPEEEMLNERKLGIEEFIVRAFDRRGKKLKDGIAVAGKKLYLFSAAGALLNNPYSFKSDVQGIKIARLTKERYRDSIIIQHQFCGPRFEVFDNLGSHNSTISSGGVILKEDFDTASHSITCFLKDINGDGVDEFINNGKAWGTQDGGLSWEMLWENKKIGYAWINMGNNTFSAAVQWLDPSAQYEKGFYCRRIDSLFAIDFEGKVLFEKKLPLPKEFNWNKQYLPFTSGDFHGDGINDDVAVIASNGVNVLDVTGNSICFPIDVGGEEQNILVQSIESGRLLLSDKADAIVIGMQGAIIAFDNRGSRLWRYGTGVEGEVRNLFISDLDKNGDSEVIVGTGNKILILTNGGRLINEVTLPASFVRFAEGDNNNPNMDIADINNDGYKEILAVTSDGSLCILGASKDD